MNTLTDLYNQAIVPMDEELEKQAAELVKQAEEEDAAGRIMARGFADELHKLAQPPPAFHGSPALQRAGGKDPGYGEFKPKKKPTGATMANPAGAFKPANPPAPAATSGASPVASAKAPKAPKV